MARGLECRACGNTDLRVVDSRRIDGRIRRRRRCTECQHRQTSYEIFSGDEGEDPNRLGNALQLYDKVLSIPDQQRGAVLAMIDTLRGPGLPTFAPPLVPSDKH